MSIDQPSTVMEAGRYNIIIVDTRRLSREALKGLLSTQFIHVIAEGSSIQTALISLPPGSHPHLLIQNLEADCEMAGALPDIRWAKKCFPDMKVVVLTECLKPDFLLPAVLGGIEAFLSRDISADILKRALELVLHGQHLLPASLAQLALWPLDPAKHGALPDAELGHLEAATAADLLQERSRAISLSARENQILQCLVQGLSNKLIAREFNISEATVKVHVKALLRKTQMANRTQAAIWAVNNRIGEQDNNGNGRGPAPDSTRHLHNGQQRHG